MTSTLHALPKSSRKAAARSLAALRPIYHPATFRTSVYAAMDDARLCRTDYRDRLAHLHKPSLEWSRQANEMAKIGGYRLP